MSPDWCQIMEHVDSFQRSHHEFNLSPYAGFIWYSEFKCPDSCSGNIRTADPRENAIYRSISWRRAVRNRPYSHILRFDSSLMDVIVIAKDCAQKILETCIRRITWYMDVVSYLYYKWPTLYNYVGSLYRRKIPLEAYIIVYFLSTLLCRFLVIYTWCLKNVSVISYLSHSEYTWFD